MLPNSESPCILHSTRWTEHHGCVHGFESTVLTLFADRLEIAGPSIPWGAAAGSTVVIFPLTPLQVFPDDEVWSDGMGLVFLLHVQADVAIFVLVWLEDQRRKRAGADEESESE